MGWKGTVNIEGLKFERSLGAIVESERMVGCTLTTPLAKGQLRISMKATYVMGKKWVSADHKLRRWRSDQHTSPKLTARAITGFQVADPATATSQT